MQENFNSLKSNPLFNGISPKHFEQMFKCLCAVSAKYQKNQFIFLSGDSIHSIGLILSGSVKIIQEDREGNSTILTELSVPDLFGEVFVCAGIIQIPVTVQACEDCEILFMDYKKIINSCSSACPHHSRLIENMLTLLAQKNLMLNQKNAVLSKRSTREKLLYFFDLQRGGAKKFTVPYNREEMAHYLCVDRSAMSNELCKMRDEGLIQFHKNKFELLRT